MATDNRTTANDCDANTGWSGDDTANAISTAGSFIEGAGALSTQLSNADEHMITTEDSVGGGAFGPIDWSDSTLYMNIKDNLGDSYANGGIQFVVGDGTDTTGYDIAGNDAVGMPHELFFAAYKLDVSVVVASPGTNFTNFAGTEANNNQAAATQIGYGSLHLAKAVGSVDNVIMDGFYYIANDSYALTIDGGTSGTPETMADVLADNNSSGWGLVNNPFGNAYGFFGPTEWGTPSGTANSYFTATNEQWFWIGDNQGGRAVGATHFPFRLVGNGTGTNSFVIQNCVVVNTGQASEFDCSDTNMDIVTIERCTFDGLASFDAPSAGTSDSCVANTFVNCGQVTGNECDFAGSSFITPTVAADGAALNWNETISTTHTVSELDDCTFEMGTNNHHAISFPTTVSDGANVTLRNIEFTGFDADGTGDSDNSIIEVLATTGTITLTLEGCTVDGATASDSTFTVDARAGATVNLVFDTVTMTVNIKDNEGNNEQDVRVWVAASDGTGDLPFNQAITSITQAAGSPFTRTVTFTAAHGLKTNDYLSLSGITNATEDNSGAFQVTVTSTTVCTYISADTGETNITGTITGTGGFLYGTTDASGNISASRTWGGDQPYTGQARKSSASPRFKTIELNGDISSTIDTVVNRRLVLDE